MRQIRVCNAGDRVILTDPLIQSEHSTPLPVPSPGLTFQSVVLQYSSIWLAADRTSTSKGSDKEVAKARATIGSQGGSSPETYGTTRKDILSTGKGITHNTLDHQPTCFALPNASHLSRLIFCLWPYCTYRGCVPGLAT